MFFIMSGRNRVNLKLVVDDNEKPISFTKEKEAIAYINTNIVNDNTMAVVLRETASVVPYIH